MTRLPMRIVGGAWSLMRAAVSRASSGAAPVIGALKPLTGAAVDNAADAADRGRRAAQHRQNAYAEADAMFRGQSRRSTRAQPRR